MQRWAGTVGVGFKNVEVFRAVDKRNATARQLVDQGVIEYATYRHLLEGRKRHYELSSIAEVGTYLSHLGTCDETRGVLVAEDDAVPQPMLGTRLMQALLLPDADVVVFGPAYVGDLKTAGWPSVVLWNEQRSNATAQDSGESFERLHLHPEHGFSDRTFWGLHTVLYTHRGCQRLRAQLLDRPISMQIDHTIGFLSALGMLQVYIETGQPSSHAEALSKTAQARLRDAKANRTNSTISGLAVFADLANRFQCELCNK